MRLLVLSIALAVALAAAGTAHGRVRDATTIDGPSADIVDVGGVTMAEDGTGGIVYRKTVDGVSRIFAAQFTKGEWRAPQLVDAGQRFGASFPAIGAANGGQLVVVWVQEFGVGSDRLWSAVLGRGASSFQAPTLVDNSVGEATGTFPSVSLNRGGQGYLAYSAVTSSDANASLPAGYVTVERRLARFSGQYWNGLGTSFARNSAQPVRRPTAENAPKIVTDTAGNGIIAWQEPDDQFVDRIWARRLFGATIGFIGQVSPSTLEEKPLRAGADAFALDSAGFGQGAITFRQLPATGAAIKTPINMVSLIAETFVEESAKKFSAPQRIDAGAEGALGAPSVAVTPQGVFLSAFAVAQNALTVRGDEFALDTPERADAGTSSVAPEPLVELAANGAAALAYAVVVNRRAGVELQELRADGVPQRRVVSTAAGGVVTGLRLAGSGLGDALTGWVQGSGATTQIGAGVIDAPPGRFQVNTPIGWQRTRSIELEWGTSAHAIGGVRYLVTVDDEVIAENLERPAFTLRGENLGDGRQVVAVVATDDGGQETTSDPAILKIDNSPPEVQIRARPGRRVEVELVDDQSGVDVATASLRIGEGKLLRAERRWSVKLARGGRFKTIVRARDKAGNRVRDVQMVRVK